MVKKPRSQLHVLAEGAGSTCNTSNDSVSVNSPPLLICPLDDVDPSPLPAVPTSVSTPAAEPYAAATPLLAPATSTDKCSACLERSRKGSTLRKGNLRLRRKVAELKQTIRELQSVSSNFIKIRNMTCCRPILSMSNFSFSFAYLCTIIFICKIAIWISYLYFLNLFKDGLWIEVESS